MRTTVECSGTYMCNVADPFVKGHMTIMMKCIAVLMFTLLITLSSYEVFILT